MGMAQSSEDGGADEHVSEPEAAPGPSGEGEGGASSPTRCTVARRYTKLDYRSFLLESHGKVFDSYNKVGDLGEGAFGDVWLARERMRAGEADEAKGRKVAVKRVRKPNSGVGLDEEEADSEEAIVDFRTEVDLMKSLDHPSICRLLNVFEDAKNIYLIMEHIQGGELFERVMAMGSFSEEDARQVIRQVAEALAYCHAHGVVHRDIKPENILIVDDEDDDVEELTVKVIDFGFGCRILRGVKLKAKVGTFLYTAPEALKGDACDEGIDLWALGCVLFVLLSGSSPFFGADVRSTIVKGKFSFDAAEWSDVSSDAKDLVKCLLEVDSSKRISARGVHSHPWLAKIGSPGMSARGAVALTGAIKRFKGHKQRGQLGHIWAGVLARQLDEARLTQLHDAFAAADTDGNGTLSFRELKAVCEGLGFHNSDEIRELFADTDMDGSGHVDYTEFIAACLDQKTQGEEQACWSAFRVFDQDGNGSISFSELHAVVTGADMNGNFSAETLKSIWKELTGEELGDRPPETFDGEVDFDHFLVAVGNSGAAKPPGGAADSAALPSPEGRATAPTPGISGALPIAGRQRHSVAGSLPIAGRRASLDAKASGLALPMLARRGGPPASGGGHS